MEVYIIIVTYNAMPWIEQCLKSTANNTVIVVDNASSDDTLAYIQAEHSGVISLPQKTNLGFGQANNIGISYALDLGADYVFLLNQDAYLEPACIAQLINYQIKFPEFGILSPLHLNGQGDRLDKNFSYHVNYQANPDFYSDFVLNKPKKEIYEVPFVNAAGWLLSTSCIKVVGGFDPVFFHYGEDDNYCQRLKYHGFKIGVCKELRLMHDRETRKTKKIISGSNEYFNKKGRILKINFGNINKPYNGELIRLARKRRKAYRKSFIKMNFERARYYKKEVEMLQLVHEEVIHSRAINEKIGRHYLNKSKDS